MLQGKKILLGVCGSIAAYKSALITRLLVKQGAEVRVVMTPSALDFITPLTLSTLSKNPVLYEFAKDKSGQWNNHVELGLWADALIMAPASANTLAKMANGFCDNLLLAVYLSARCPVFFAPAMDLDMYQHPSTLHNLAKLKGFGNIMIDAEHGELASGLVGTGRMAEPEHILERLENFFNTSLPLKGKKAIVTAGPTFEAIDPVRFIGNHSTGKMGFAIAEELQKQGAEVTLISGPTQVELENKCVKRLKVKSAQQMFEAANKLYTDSDIAVFAAAVADYRPKNIINKKIKKEDGPFTNIELEKTIDVASSLGKIKKSNQFNVGFALETDNEQVNALAKLKNKNFDMVVLNSLKDEGAGFGHDTNKITIIHQDESIKHFGLKTKKEVAADIVAEIIQKHYAHQK